MDRPMCKKNWMIFVIWEQRERRRKQEENKAERERAGKMGRNYGKVAPCVGFWRQSDSEIQIEHEARSVDNKRRKDMLRLVRRTRS